MIQSYSCRAGLCVGFYDNDGGILCQTNSIKFYLKHISIIVPLGQSSLVNIEGSLQILSEINVLRAAKGEDPLFHIPKPSAMYLKR